MPSNTIYFKIGSSNYGFIYPEKAVSPKVKVLKYNYDIEIVFEIK